MCKTHDRWSRLQRWKCWRSQKPIFEFTWVFFFVIFSCLISSCERNPVTGKQELHFVSESQEIQLGEEVYGYMQQAEGGDYVTDEEVQEYVEKVGKRLAAVSDRPHLPYEFTVLNNSVPNAWALPGGKIAINRGLLTELNNEAELAAVLSHEIVHSAARHGAKMIERSILTQLGLSTVGGLLQGHKYEDALMQTASTGTGLVQLKYSRSAELEADRYGIKYMVAAGYDPQAAVDLQKTFLKLSEGKDQNWLNGLLSTHPPSKERIKANEATLTLYPQGGRWGIKEYEQAMKTLKKDKPAYEDLDKGYEALLKGNTKRALLLANEGISIEPKEAHLFNLKGKAEVLMKDYSSGLSSFDHAISLNPHYFDFYLQRGLLKKQLGRRTEAREDLEKSNSLLPSAEAHQALGEIALQEGRSADATRHFQIASEAGKTQAHSASAPNSQKKLLTTSLSDIEVKVTVMNDHKVKLGIWNKGAKAIRNLTLELTFYDAKGTLLTREELFVKERIASQGHINISASFNAPPISTSVNVKIHSFELSE